MRMHSHQLGLAEQHRRPVGDPLQVHRKGGTGKEKTFFTMEMDILKFGTR